MKLGRWVALGGILLLAAVLALGLRRDPREVRSATVGKPAPAFDLPRIDAPGRLNRDALGGKTIVLNFFASWCLPCKDEQPALVRVWERYRAADVVVIGVVYQDDPDAALAFTRRYGGTWPIAIDDGGRTALAYGVFGIPETFFIAPDGVIAYRHVGAIDEATLTTAIEAIRAKPATVGGARP